MTARSPIKRRRSKPRRGPLRDREYLRFLREEGKCVACLSVGGRPSDRVACLSLVSAMGCDPAHGPVNGMRSKGPDDGAIPLGRVHHDEQHRLRWPAFEEKYGFSREREAKVWWTVYQIWKENNRSWALQS